ncbi:UDP-N-acetylmuramate--L-alanine ligase [Psychroflexus tropicus]|uniref:UDP-N-acetylmuramate--L-alanine ligase n=1 Tax=Psychroflexus tropicus TaxID=197345 RepID=UPI000366D9C6|nr:UDP-N-acetylmuramate--L-alanine ligase [Psychroflexus tropicus]
MKALNAYTHVVFIGIGGIGMSALARYFNQKGHKVLGYDKTETELTSAMKSEGIAVYYSQEELIDLLKIDLEQILVIYTPAISDKSLLHQYFKSHNIELYKRSVILGEVTKSMPTLAVAGTHGKTTTSAILAHILKASGIKLTAFCGGVLSNYNTNYIGDGEEVVVVEADEFDRSFLQLHPSAAVINSMDADHLDIYDTPEQLTETFKAFSNLVPNHHLYMKSGLSLMAKTIGIEEDSDISVKNILVKNGSYRFDIKTKITELSNLEFSLPGHHNLLNAAAALALAIDFKPELTSAFGSALASFKGVKRRFNYIHKSDRLVVIDDYAHHPTEIDAVHQAILEMHPNKKSVVIFQPHLFTRTRDFAEGFARSLSKFDEVNLLDIYPAREEPIEGVTSEYLLNLIDHPEKALIKKRNIHDKVTNAEDKVIVLLGAGDIGVEATNLLKHWHENV